MPSQGNHSMVQEFILLGLSQVKEVQMFLFLLFLVFYSLILPSNILIIVTIQNDPHLSAPMYFFLANLAFLDICYCLVTPPKMLADFFSSCKTISYGGCMAQIFFLHWLGGAETFLIIAMAIDRYVAICYPLRYSSLITRAVRSLLVLTSWFLGFLHSIIQIALLIPLPFCGPSKLDNFFCDITQIIKLACTDTYTVEYIMIMTSGFSILICFIILLISYGILLVKVRIGSGQEKNKAASTCITHIIIVFVMFGPAIYIYCRPFQDFPIDKVVTVFHTVVFPLMNPMIYTLRNKEIKQAIWRMIGKHSLCGWKVKGSKL